MRGCRVVRQVERPSRRDVAELLKEHGALRACQDTRTGDLYVWYKSPRSESFSTNMSDGWQEDVGQILSIEDFDHLTK